jgi:dTDP-glucose pyrophosphorylase
MMAIHPGDSIADAIAAIDSTPARIALLVDNDGRLTSTVTDGDVRRGILAGLDAVNSVSALTRFRATQYMKPVVANVSSSADEQQRIMIREEVRHLPLIDDSGRLAGLVLLTDLVDEQEREVSAVVFAGGFGARLSPLTDEMPKPMLPIGGRPILEWVIDQLKASNVRDVMITTHYRPESISEHFGDGEKFGIGISYAHEPKPLGTAGGLRLMDRPQHPILIINGDILTDLNFRDMINFHVEHDAEMSVAVRKYQTRVDYGIVETDGIKITSLAEKPTLDFFINAGIYVLEPSCFDHLPSNGRFDMTDLIGKLLESNRNVISFPVREYWLDIGQRADYEKAVQDNGSFGGDQ